MLTYLILILITLLTYISCGYSNCGPTSPTFTNECTQFSTSSTACCFSRTNKLLFELTECVSIPVNSTFITPFISNKTEDNGGTYDFTIDCGTSYKSDSGLVCGFGPITADNCYQYTNSTTQCCYYTNGTKSVCAWGNNIPSVDLSASQITVKCAGKNIQITKILNFSYYLTIFYFLFLN
jgi:hypothetical protein